MNDKPEWAKGVSAVLGLAGFAAVILLLTILLGYLVGWAVDVWGSV